MSVCASMYVETAGLRYFFAVGLMVYIFLSSVVTYTVLTLNAALGRITTLHITYMVVSLTDYFALAVFDTTMYRVNTLFLIIKLGAYFTIVPAGYLASLGWSEYLLALKTICHEYPDQCTSIGKAMGCLKRVGPREFFAATRRTWCRFRMHKLWLAARYSLTGPCCLAVLPIWSAMVIINFINFALYQVIIGMLVFANLERSSSEAGSSALEFCFPNTVSLSLTIVSLSLDSIMFASIFVYDPLDNKCISIILKNRSNMVLGAQITVSAAVAGASENKDRVKETDLWHKSRNKADHTAKRPNNQGRELQGSNRDLEGVAGLEHHNSGRFNDVVGRSSEPVTPVDADEVLEATHIAAGVAAAIDGDVDDDIPGDENRPPAMSNRSPQGPGKVALGDLSLEFVWDTQSPTKRTVPLTALFGVQRAKQSPPGVPRSDIAETTSASTRVSNVTTNPDPEGRDARTPFNHEAPTPVLIQDPQSLSPQHDHSPHSPHPHDHDEDSEHHPSNHHSHPMLGGKVQFDSADQKKKCSALCRNKLFALVSPRERFKTVMLRWQILMGLLLKCDIWPLLVIQKFLVITMPILLVTFAVYGVGQLLAIVYVLVYWAVTGDVPFTLYQPSTSE